MLLWYTGGHGWGEYLGFPKGYAEVEYRGESFLVACIYLVLFVVPDFNGIICRFWRFLSDNKWQKWSIWGSAFILFNIWFGVQVSVAINAWYGPFWDMIQKMLSDGGGNINDLYKWNFDFPLYCDGCCYICSN